MDPINSEVRLDGIPIWLLAVMSSLAILGMIYALAVIIFNLAKAKNKIIKMTSPNINVVMLVGAICGYSCIIMFGLDTGYVSRTAMENLQTTCVFVLAFSFTIIYGCLFAKSWRVFLVFKNINFNGKLTRDEHLLIGILVMLLIDLGILLPWYLVDPIQCTNRTITTVYEDDLMNPVSYTVDDCHSELQGLWIALLYVYKLLLILAGLYFTWQTRNITLPSLKDTKLIYTVVFMLITMAIIALPTILISYVGMKTRYASGGLIVWIVLTVTISVLFVPKIILERKNRDSSNNISAFNFLFSESMRKTQEAVKKCSLCFCCGDATESDRYVQEMLANEIDTLKRTIKQKDASIRELNDRLYIGTEKFQEYLTSPKSSRTVLQAMQEKYESRKKKQQSENPQDYPLQNLESHNVPIHCPKPISASSNGFIPHSNHGNGIPHHPQQYEDEGIHSSDSYLPNTATSNNHHTSQSLNNKHSTSHHNLYKPIQTVSNGFIPRSGSTASGYYHQQHVRHQSHTDGYRTLPLQPVSKYKEHNNNTTASYRPTREVTGHRIEPLHQWRRQSFSPNQDSAFDDNSPSSDGYDKYSTDKAQTYSGNVRESSQYSSNQTATEPYHSHDTQYGSNHGGIAQDRQFSQIDLGAMEYDAVKNFQRTPSISRKHKDESAIQQPQAYYNDDHHQTASYNVSVSQI